ncbi:MAG: response regulator [Planctomycetes bacterium]|nr:response regulator [Planctomycetota bacterium]
MISEAVPQMQSADAADSVPYSILIVDDDRSQVESLAFRLRKQGFTTVHAFDGKRGLAIAREQRPDLVLLDLILPDVDGFEVCEALVDAPETCDIPIIVVTGSERPDIVRTSRAAGCEYFVRKPFDPNVLLTLIQHAISRTGWAE